MLVARKVAVVVAVAVIKQSARALLTLLAVLALVHGRAATAGVLPEERSDVMYHSYQGGGMDITGPSVLVRKNFLEKVSISANYYVDNVSAASVDVESYASPYTEERKEASVGVDYLHNKTTMSFGHTTSEESDYDAKTTFFGISQDFFGDLTTISLGYALGDDEVRRNNYQDGSLLSSDPVGTVDRQNYRLSLSQVLTKNLIASLGFETITDEGFLNNPYRQVRYLSDTGVGTQSEVYPNTRTSDAAALRAMYYLPWRASLRGEFRSFADTWGIEARSMELRYVHPWNDKLSLEFKLRQYKQTAADFYSDLFPRQDAQNFLARDKELATFSNWTAGIGGSYTWSYPGSAVEQLKLSLFVDHMEFDYDDFRDIPTGRELGTGDGNEPFYSFSADVFRLFLTVTY